MKLYPENNQRFHSAFFFTLLITLVLFSPLKGQNSSKTSSINALSADYNTSGQVTIKYSSEILVNSFLVFIIDPDGNNIFLDSKRRYKGDYLKVIDVSSLKKGEFSLTIICDEVKLNKKINVK